MQNVLVTSIDAKECVPEEGLSRCAKRAVCRRCEARQIPYRAHQFLVNAATKPGKGTLNSFAKARLSVQEVEETVPKEGLELRGIVHVQEKENAETTAFG